MVIVSTLFRQKKKKIIDTLRKIGLMLLVRIFFENELKR